MSIGQNIKKIRVCELKMGDEFSEEGGCSFRVIDVGEEKITARWINNRSGRAEGWSDKVLGRKSKKWVFLVTNKGDE